MTDTTRPDDRIAAVQQTHTIVPLCDMPNCPHVALYEAYGDTGAHVRCEAHRMEGMDEFYMLLWYWHALGSPTA
jgi:hypothetical protein